MSFWGSLVLWLFLSLGWFVLFWLDLALDWFFLTFDWLGLTLNLLPFVFDWLVLVFGWLLLSLFLSRLLLSRLHHRERRDRVQSSVLWVRIIVKVNWLCMWVVFVSHHRSGMVSNSTTVDYGRVSWMAAILDSWLMHVVCLLIGSRMIHLSDLLMIIMRRVTEVCDVGVMSSIAGLHLVRSGLLIKVTDQLVAFCHVFNLWRIGIMAHGNNRIDMLVLLEILNN